MKNKLIAIATASTFLLTSGLSIALITATRPIETQEKTYIRAKAELDRAKEAMQVIETKERNAFCRLVNLKHTDNIPLDDPKSKSRYIEDCRQVFEASDFF